MMGAARLAHLGVSGLGPGSSHGRFTTSIYPLTKRMCLLQYGKVYK